MADPAGEGLSPKARDSASLFGDSADIMDTSDDLNDPESDTIKLLNEISSALEFSFDSLPPEVQASYMHFQRDNDAERFHQQLDEFFGNRMLDVFLLENPDSRYIANKLFGKQHSYLADPTLRDPSLSPAEALFTHEEGMESEQDDDNQADPPTGHLYAVRTISSPTSAKASRRSRNRNLGPNPIIRLTGDSQPESMPTPTPDQPRSRLVTRAPEITRRLPSVSEFSILRELYTADFNDGPQAETENLDLSGWLRNWLGPPGVDTSEDANLHDYNGWKIEAPKIMLIRAKNFLADEDVDRTVDWPTKFAELAEYFQYLEENLNGEDWNEDLYEAKKMLNTHWLFEQYHYGCPKLTLDFPNVWPAKSERLPLLPGALIVEDPKGPIGDDMGERQLLVTEIRSAHDVQYNMPREALKTFLHAYVVDASEFWTNRAERPHPVRGADALLSEEERRFNMVKCDDQYYDRCIQGGMKTTARLLATECEFRPSPDDIAQLPSDSSKVDVQSLQSFAKFRGARRAALQQCLNTFDNLMHPVVSTSWRALILPPPQIPDEEPGIIFPTIQAKHIPEKEARDPFSYTLGYRWYINEERKWGEWVREYSTKGAFGERAWAHRDDPIMDLPVNFKGPYVEHFMDREMKKVFDLLRTCGRLHQRLKRAERWAPRVFLRNVLSLIERGIENKDPLTANLQVDFRSNEYRKKLPGQYKPRPPRPQRPPKDKPDESMESAPAEDQSDDDPPGIVLDEESEHLSEHDSDSDLKDELGRYASDQESESLSEHDSDSEPEDESGRYASGRELPKYIHIRPEEVKWLHFVGGPSINEKYFLKKKTSNRLARLFEGRVDEMLEDLDADSLFSSTKPVAFDKFMFELNQDAEKPIKRHQFTREDALGHITWLIDGGKLHFYLDDRGDEWVCRPRGAFHPEDRVRWARSERCPESESSSDEESEAAIQERRRKRRHDKSRQKILTKYQREVQEQCQKQIQDKILEISQLQASADSDAESEFAPRTISTDVSVIESDDLGDYTATMPKFENLRTWRECPEEYDDVHSVLPDTENFFYSLAYRLGVTLRELRKQHRANRRWLNKEKKLENRRFVEDVTKYWIDDAIRVPNDEANKFNKGRLHKITPSRFDVVRMVEPEAVYEGRKTNHSDDEDSGLGRTRVGIIREAYENKDMLHPVRRAFFEGADGVRREIRRREPLWWFAHPDHRPKGPRFWDINRWPPHLQSETTRTKIRFSGPQTPEMFPTRPPPPPRVQPPDPEHQRPTPSAKPPQTTKASPPPRLTKTREIEIPFSDPDVGRRRFQPGPPEFWAGDTPLQRKVMEESARRMYEPDPKPPRRSLFSILSRSQKTEVDPTALPEVDPRIIPKSKPRGSSSEEIQTQEDLEEPQSQSENSQSQETVEESQPQEQSEEESHAQVAEELAEKNSDIDMDPPAKPQQPSPRKRHGKRYSNRFLSSDEEDLYGVTPPKKYSPPPAQANPTLTPWRRRQQPAFSQSIHLKIIDSSKDLEEDL
ncbi:hypothetical protein EDB81DRAFT_882147 [Dactylonectria macrodidyma]|uniref:Uncharacterized protein n=1 Tax=Dactylonectria macrodidyma TaxID=307937 RepID=A0A9P9J6P4_9HYPO|nr:hypothetical protein EDB81DRAFT_882147 [Dactylonectria macrodidyma]